LDGEEIISWKLAEIVPVFLSFSPFGQNFQMLYFFQKILFLMQMAGGDIDA